MGKYDNILKQIFINKRGIDKHKLVRLDNYPNIKRYLEQRYNDSDSIEETLKRLQFNIEHKNICICGKPVKFVGGTRMFLKTCGNTECSKKTNQLHLQETCIKKYGVTNAAKCDSVKQKQKETNIDRYGTISPLQNNVIKSKTIETNIDRYGTSISQQSDIVKHKIAKSNRETCEKKYGVTNISKLPNINIQRNNTKRENNTFNTSTQEDDAFILLSILFNDIVRQYSDERYPFNCDFYIPSLDLFIECNFSWTHGGHIYDENNIEDYTIAQKWYNSESKYYNNAFETWVVRDRNKYKYLKKLNHIIFWNIKDVYKFIIDIPLNDNLLLKEYNNLIKTKGSLTTHWRQNNIIKYFQQDVFYKTEKELWNDNNIRNKLIENRKYYLQKDTLTVYDILNGFKRSCIYYGYSHFNPLWFKWFIETYNIKTCYDPCGGWGHRLLGAHNLDLYIYNDLSISTYNNVNRIIDYFNIINTITYNNDASIFIPKEPFEAMFTCPPYYNVEEYECDGFNTLDDYFDFLNSIFNLFFNNDECRIFGIVIREDLLPSKYHYTIKYELNIPNKTHIIKEKQFNEYLYIFTK